jgi:hypothetical protein
VKAAEVLTRYTAVLSLASSASTRPEGDDLPEVVGFEGNLSFGSFELSIYKAASVSWDHPLRDDLRAAMSQAKRNPGKAGANLRAFVELRNELGHSIVHVDEIKASNLFEEVDPIGRLLDCLDGLSPVLSCPPVVVLRQEHRRGRLTARFNFHIGEGEPIPREIDLADPVFEWEYPYLCTARGLLPLTPGVVLLVRPDGKRGLYLLDGIEDEGLRYKGVLDNDVRVVEGTGADLGRWLATRNVDPPEPSGLPMLEEVRSADGRSLHGYLRDDPLPTDVAAGLTSGIAEDDPAGWSVASFEQACNNVGLGAAYRDVLYVFLEEGCRAEASLQGVEVVNGSEDNRTLLVFELHGGPVLTCTLQLGALDNGTVGTRSVSFAPGQPADTLVNEVRALLAAR